MAKTIVITIRGRNTETGRVEDIVSHGLDFTTNRPVDLTGNTPQELGAAWDADMGEWVLDQDRPALHMGRYAA
jgi:hypothetical protein